MVAARPTNIPAELDAKLRDLLSRDADMRDYLEAVWLAHTSGTSPRPPYLALDRFDEQRKHWVPRVEDVEGAALCHNELSIARLCALNALKLNEKLVGNELQIESAAGSHFVAGVLRQFGEEVEHAVAHCVDLRFDRPCKFKLFKALADQSLATRLLAIITLELREMSIRPRRLGDCQTADCDLLALIDDVGHIQFGTRLLAAVISSGEMNPSPVPIRQYLIDAHARHPERPPARCGTLVVERLVDDRAIRSWIYEADPVFDPT